MISHDPHSIGSIPWKGLTVHPRSEEPEETKAKVERHARELKNLIKTK